MPTRDKTKNKEYQKRWYEKNKKLQLERNNSRKKDIKKKLREYKATLSCEICGENHPSCIDFHHRNPSNKKVAIYEATQKKWGWNKIMEEINKCQVLCSNCHRKAHWEPK
jgi:transcription elongation factor Elf1